MPGPSLPMSYLSSLSRLALLAYALMFAAIATAAQPGAAPSSAAQTSSFVETILGVTVNRQQEDEPIIALRDSAGRVFINAADLTRWRLRLPDMAPTMFQGERYYALAEFAGLVATVDEQ